MTSDGGVVRRLAPPDRRSPTKVGRDMCPLGSGCWCCPVAVERWHGNPRSQRTCTAMHPPQDRVCRPPYPPNIAPCPERQTLPQDPPARIGCPPRFELCIECGRITARRWNRPDGYVVAWCAGQFF